MHHAAFDWDVEAVRRLLEDGVSPNAREDEDDDEWDEHWDGGHVPLHKLALSAGGDRDKNRRVRLFAGVLLRRGRGRPGLRGGADGVIRQKKTRMYYDKTKLYNPITKRFINKKYPSAARPSSTR